MANFHPRHHHNTLDQLYQSLDQLQQSLVMSPGPQVQEDYDSLSQQPDLAYCAELTDVETVFAAAAADIDNFFRDKHPS
jgi:hypothetical protein